jgi:putative FmdB family regulatory protein
MPNYDYECPHCEKTFEIFQSMKDKRLEICPECGKSGLKRLIGSGAGIIFKGNGFYCTDYRSSNYEKDKQKDLASAKKCDNKSCPAKGACPQKTA